MQRAQQIKSAEKIIRDVLYATDKHGTHTILFMSVLVITVLTFLSIVEWITIFRYVYIMKNYLVLRNCVPLLHTKTLMNHSNILLNKRSHIQRAYGF